MTTTTTKTFATIAVLLAAACGGGSDDAGGTGSPTATVVSGTAQMSQAGLVVNGITFQTSGATIKTDDSATPATLAGEDNIRAFIADGMVVRVRGTRDDSGTRGNATEIEVHDLLEGSIDDRGPGRLRVAGATVSVDDSTVFADNRGGRLTPDDFSSGERVEISGHSDGRGGVRATSVRKSSAGPEVEREIRAWIVAANGSVLDLSFEKNGAPALSVDISGVVPAPSVSVGDFVEVKTRGATNANGVDLATDIHRDDDFRAGTGVVMQIEGIVSASSASGFTLAGQQVAYTPTTTFVGGTIDDVVPGVKVEAQGQLDGEGGTLVASKVKIRPIVRVDANLESVNAAASSFTLLGFDVRVTPATDLRGIGELSSLPAGARIEVRGSPRRDGSGIDAMRVEVVSDQSNDRAFVRGLVTEKTATSQLKLLGLTIDTSRASFRDHLDNTITAGAFFDAIVPNETVVKVRWRPYPASTAAAVEEAELEND